MVISMNDIMNFIKNNPNVNIIFIFFIFIAICVFFGFSYIAGLYPTKNKIQKIINKFTIDNYSIPYHIAERYLIWINMRTFFFVLNYSLTLISIISTLMTAYYASTDANNQTIIFLSLLATFLTMANIFINSGTKAHTSQHAWRELDMCITLTIHNKELNNNAKNIIIANKITEMEKYMELHED